MYAFDKLRREIDYRVPVFRNKSLEAIPDPDYILNLIPVKELVYQASDYVIQSGA
jgi:hypothetical protein